MHNRSKDHCSPNMMYHLDKGSPHSHVTPVAVVLTTAGIPSTKPLPWYYREFQSNSRSNTADTAVIPLPCHCLLATPR